MVNCLSSMVLNRRANKSGSTGRGSTTGVLVERLSDNHEDLYPVLFWTRKTGTNREEREGWKMVNRLSRLERRKAGVCLRERAGRLAGWVTSQNWWSDAGDVAGRAGAGLVQVRKPTQIPTLPRRECVVTTSERTFCACISWDWDWSTSAPDNPTNPLLSHLLLSHYFPLLSSCLSTTIIVYSLAHSYKHPPSSHPALPVLKPSQPHLSPGLRHIAGPRQTPPPGPLQRRQRSSSFPIASLSAQENNILSFVSGPSVV